MNNCPFCNSQVPEDAAFCTTCGKQFATTTANNAYVSGSMPQMNNTPPMGNATYPGAGYGAGGYAQPAPAVDPYDHTAEFDAKDISDNKVMSMLVYLLGIVGVFLATIASNSSPYVAFHVRQSLKFVVVEMLMAICTALLCWTIIVPFAASIMYIVLAVIKIICFFQICSGKAKEPAIIRSCGFLK